MDFLVSKECSFFETASGNSVAHFGRNIDHAVLDGVIKVIENEIYGLKELEKLKV
jgi:hypothetical protein